MIKKYSLYYRYISKDDYLIIPFETLKDYKEERNGNVSLLKHNDTLVGYKIYDFKEVIKIRSTGLIALPSDNFVEIINNILLNNKLETLDSKNVSGYFVSNIIEVNNDCIKCQIGTNIIYCQKVDDVKVNDQVIVAVKGTGLPDLSFVNEEGHICSYLDLEINDSNATFVLDDKEECGNDFFRMEEK